MLYFDWTTMKNQPEILRIPIVRTHLPNGASIADTVCPIKSRNGKLPSDYSFNLIKKGDERWRGKKKTDQEHGRVLIG